HDPPGDGPTLGRGFFELIPDLEAVCALVGKKNISFDLFPTPVKHYFDHVAWFDRRLRIYKRKLRGGNEAFALASDIDNDFFIRNAENATVEDLEIVGCEMAAVFD